MVTDENSEHTDVSQTFSFISDILKARPSENKHIKDFATLIREDFTLFCDSVSGLNQMKDVSVFEKIINEMKLISNCPPLHSKMVGAIGGGFSSGKSSFINSFMKGDSVQLATGIVPVTAIPSYVIRGDKPDIKGVSFRGGSFGITKEMYQAISHELIKKLDFNLKEILSYVTVTTNLTGELFDKICLIDTPGYDAPGIGSTEQDREIAFSYIRDAKFLIWLVGLDSKGTINSNDIEFLENFPFGKEENRKLYIVANKAGLVSPSHHQEILDTITGVLDDYDLRYEGISLYDSVQGKEYLHEGTSISDFIKSQNIATEKYSDLVRPLYEVFSRYEAYVKDKNQKDVEYQRKIKSLILDAYTSNAISLSSNNSCQLEDGLNELKKYLRPDNIDETINKIIDIRTKLTDCLDQFCSEMGIQKTDISFQNADSAIANEHSSSASFAQTRKKFCNKCGTKITDNIKFCPKCGTSVFLD